MHSFGDKIDADGGLCMDGRYFVDLFEGIMDESRYDRSFANVLISYQRNFELAKLCHYKFEYFYEYKIAIRKKLSNLIQKSSFLLV